MMFERFDDCIDALIVALDADDGPSVNSLVAEVHRLRAAGELVSAGRTAELLEAVGRARRRRTASHT